MNGGDSMAMYFKGDACIGITSDPCHKRKGLYIGNLYCIQRIATFRNDADAEAFDRLLGVFFGVVELKQGEQHDDTIT